MKILHILDHSLPLHSGYTFRSRNIFHAQKAMGLHPVILTSPKHEATWKGEWAEKEIIDDFDYYRTGAVNGLDLPLLSEFKLMSSLEKRLLGVAEIEKPDILHAHSPVLNAFPALKIGKKLGIPVVYEIRAFWEDAAVDHGTYKEGAWKYRLTKAFETHVCRKASHVTVLCNGIKQDLVGRGIPEDKLTVVFNGVNPENFKPVPSDQEYFRQWGLEGKKVIGFIGSFYRYEGLDLLIKAFARIAPDNPDTVLLLVGGGEMEQELKSLATKLGLATHNSHSSIQASQHPSFYACQHPSIPASQQLRSRVIFPGRIPHDRVPGVYSMIDVLAFPRYSMRLTELVTP